MSRQDYKNIAVCLSIVSVWTAILFFCVYQPYKAHTAALREKTQEYNLRMSEAADFFAERGSKEEYRRRLDANIKIMQEKVPGELLESEFIDKLNEAADLTNVQIIMLNPGDYKEYGDDEKERYGGKQWTVHVRGSYFDVLKFLRQLNLLPRLVNIKAGEIYEEDGYMVCKLTLQIYLTRYNK